MDTSVLSTESGPVITLTGRFDAHEAGSFRAALGPLLADPGAVLRVDLSAVHFIDSTALAELVRAMKASRERGGDLVLCRPTDPVQVILELTRLNMAFTIERHDQVSGT